MLLLLLLLLLLFGPVDMSRTKAIWEFWASNVSIRATRSKTEREDEYSRSPLFRSPKGNEKKFEIAGIRNNRGSVKEKGKSKGIRSSFEIAGTSN